MRQEMRREMIAKAATPIIARKGLKKTSIDDICKASGIAPRTLYLHFKNKNEIFQLIVSDFREKLNQIIMEAMETDTSKAASSGKKIDEITAYDFIKQKNYRVFKVVKENKDLLLILLREASSLEFDFYQFLKISIETSLSLVITEQRVFQRLGLIKDLEPRYTSQLIVGSMLMTLFYEIIEGDSEDIDCLAEAITKLQFYGFGKLP